MTPEPEEAGELPASGGSAPAVLPPDRGQKADGGDARGGLAAVAARLLLGGASWLTSLFVHFSALLLLALWSLPLLPSVEPTRLLGAVDDRG
ncbi:MAG: hypothetical protein AAGG46_08735, partial [Planctomycetota bacterium]